jgi:hypothetical protein
MDMDMPVSQLSRRPCSPSIHTDGSRSGRCKLCARLVLVFRYYWLRAGEARVYKGPQVSQMKVSEKDAFRKICAK